MIVAKQKGGSKMRTALSLLKKMALAGVLMLPIVIPAEAHEHFGGGGHTIVVPRYPYYYPYYYQYWGWGNPYWYYGPYITENKGWVKVKDQFKSDEVFINNAFAGTADKMKSIKLDPGNYTIQIRREGRDLLNRNIYVVAGKTVEIYPDGK
jgi:hypothetical protein